MSYRPSTLAKKVSNREMRRRAVTAIRQSHLAVQDSARAFALMLAMLKQLGSIVITDDTVKDVETNFQHYGYRVTDLKGARSVMFVDNTPLPQENV